MWNIRNKKYKKQQKYIGSSYNIEKRWKRHIKDLKNNKHDNIYLQRSWEKYEESDFVLTILEEVNKEEILITEQKYLDNIFSSEKPYMKYYNIGKHSSGGDNLTNHPDRESIIEKIRKNRKILTEKEKKKLSIKMMGENNPNYGNRWNDEQKKNNSIKLKEYYSENANYIKGKTLIEYFGKEISEKYKKRISDMAKERIGEKNSFYGKRHTEDTKKRISEKKKGKKVLSQLKPFSIDNINYLSLKDASKYTNINYSTIRDRIISKNLRFKNYQYITDKKIIDGMIKILNQ